MRRKAYYITCTFIGLFAARMLSAQGAHVPAAGHVLLAQAGHGHGGRGSAAAGAAVPPVVVKATVDKQKILIGQPIQLMLEATVPAPVPGGAGGTGKASGGGAGAPGAEAGTVLLWPNLDSLPHFEFVEKGKVDSTVQQNGQRYYRQYMTVTSFDSGAFAIPRLPFISGNKTTFTDSVRIVVDYTKTDPSKDYHDIKDIIDIPNPFAKWIGWIVAAVTIGSLVLVIWLIRKKRLVRLLSAVLAPRLSPYEEAIRQLDELEKQHLPENGSVKLYYTRLSDIFRVFLSRRVGVSSLAETSEEVIGQLRRLPVAAGSFNEIAETLRMSDFVKFAKYQPGIADTEQHFRVVRSAIEALEKAGREEEEAAAGVVAARGDERNAGNGSAGRGEAGNGLAKSKRPGSRGDGAAG